MSITQAKIYWNNSGTPTSCNYDDIYFSNLDGLAESQYVFLEKNHIPSRWASFDAERFVIAETGFGTGLNFLASCHAFFDFKKQYPNAKLQKLHFISIEKYPLALADLAKAHQIWPQLQLFSNELLEKYPQIQPGCHSLTLANDAISLALWFGDVNEVLPLIKTQQVDGWFLDGFAPSKNPDMWTTALFSHMARLAKPNCTLATFTAAGFVRRGLEQAGFAVKKNKGFGNKREMLTGEYSKI